MQIKPLHCLSVNHQSASQKTQTLISFHFNTEVELRDKHRTSSVSHSIHFTHLETVNYPHGLARGVV